MDPSTAQATHDPGRQRFVWAADGAPPAFLSYTFAGDRVIFEHTFVPDALRGQGLAAQLVRAALTEARRVGWKVVPACSYVASFIKRHPEFADVIAPANPR